MREEGKEGECQVEFRRDDKEGGKREGRTYCDNAASHSEFPSQRQTQLLRRDETTRKEAEEVSS